MGRSRNSRRRLSIWMIGVLLLAQWLVAAYACPVVAQRAATASAAIAAPAAMADCHGVAHAAMDPANPSLCKAHCEADQQAPVHATGDVPSPALAGFVVPALDLPELGVESRAGQTVPQAGAPPGWPPLYLIHGVLRN